MPFALQNPTALVGRILLGLFFVMSGFEKIPGFSGTVDYISSAGLPLASVVARQLRSGEVIACIKRPRAAPPTTSVVGNPHAAHED